MYVIYITSPREEVKDYNDCEEQERMDWEEEQRRQARNSAAKCSKFLKLSLEQITNEVLNEDLKELCKNALEEARTYLAKVGYKTRDYQSLIASWSEHSSEARLLELQTQTGSVAKNLCGNEDVLEKSAHGVICPHHRLSSGQILHMTKNSPNQKF